MVRMRGWILLLGTLASCASVSPTPRVSVSAFRPGTPRSAVEARAGEPGKTRRGRHGQLHAFYEIRLVPDPVRPRDPLALHADRASAPGALAHLARSQGQRDLGEADIAIEAATLAVDLVIRKVSEKPEPARPEPEREPPPPRRCRVEVVYDRGGRVLLRRIVPLEDAPTQVESWDDVAAPVR